MTEWDAETLLCGLFERDGARVRRQVPLGGKHVDLAASLPSTGGEWLSIEVKLRDWKRAVHQASINSAFFAMSFIAVPAAMAGHVQEDYLRARGVGLIKFDATSWWIDIEADLVSQSKGLVESIDERLA
jgi:hypothetical protein